MFVNGFITAERSSIMINIKQQSWKISQNSRLKKWGKVPGKKAHFTSNSFKNT